MTTKGRVVKQKPILLWIGDAVASTGFATVTHGVLNNLHKKYDVHVLGVNYFGDPHDYPYKIYPASTGGDVYGVRRLDGLLRNIKPHIVCVLNDPWIVQEYMPALDRPIGKLADNTDVFTHKVAYMPIDGLNIKRDFIEPLNTLDKAILYTEFGRVEVARAGFNIDKTEVIPHGFDPSAFRPIPQNDARERLNKLIGKDWFIVGCINRNQPRKRLDLTIKYFAEFARDKHPGVKLYYHGNLEDSGWDLLQLANYYGVADRIIITAVNMGSAGINREALNLVYNSFDVQISTTGGEGWGLTAMEGMACGVPQILPDWSAFGEWTKGGADLIKCTSTAANINGLNTIMGVPDEALFVEALNKAYFDKKHLAALGKAGYDLVQNPMYKWASVANAFDATFSRVMNGDDSNS